MKINSYCSFGEFDKDFKKLLKRFRTLEEDFEVMKKAVIEAYHYRGISTSAVVKIKMKNFCDKRYLLMKVRKMSCKSLKGKGGKKWVKSYLCL
ncbi:MAG: hypothetical protein LBT58_00215 [Endomicrobium sp.]|jgi:hypothetical protein|nr:hypothetical protein [Endomicrobium sp.]